MDDYQWKVDSDRKKKQKSEDTILIEEDNTIYELDGECARKRGMIENRTDKT